MGLGLFSEHDLDNMTCVGVVTSVHCKGYLGM